MHKKETVIAPLLSKVLGIPSVKISVDTDVFGTFSGEVPRKLSPLDTLRAKCSLAYEQSGISLIVASEGSFGPHPTVWFVPSNEEWILFKDYENDIEIVASLLSTETNFKSAHVSSEDELMAFANDALFPSHGLILKSLVDPVSIVKGITERGHLIDIFKSMNLEGNKVVAETDMRALYNPTRMNVIESACRELVRKIECVCPNCGMPGVDVVLTTRGLPCGNCGCPTNSILSQMMGCKKCEYRIETKYPHGKEIEDPMYCDYCNP
jgi:hypothetical protein